MGSIISIKLSLSVQRSVASENMAEVSAASQTGEWSMECGICYSYKLGDTEQLPGVSCEDEKCCQTFHQACLHEWLVQLPDTRTSLNMVTGECPYCSKPIQCAKPALT